MIEIKHLSKTFQMKDGAVNALKDISLTIPDGSIYGIIGMSGAGKSTLVRCINLLERPTEGSVVIDGVEMEKLTPAQLRQRRREITMIFQQFNLLMQRSCLKNICFPMELAGVKKEEAEKRAKELGMRISHSWYPPAGVADYAIMLMLMCNRKVGQILRRADAQDYSLSGKMGRDISGCTVGVIGTGKIGQTVIRHLSGFGCKILAYDLYPNDAVRQYADYVTLDELYAQSDIITLHTNATAENHHLINAGALAKMKDGVLLVNTARGTLIDPDALIAGLESGKIGGAGLDVIEDETGIYYYNRMGQAIQNRELNLLRSYPNVIVSPHTAFYTDVNVASMVQSPFEALDAYAHGQPYAGEVQL